MIEMASKETGEGEANKRGIEISAIFALDYLVKDYYRAAVVTRVLNEFGRLPRGDKARLKSAVNDTVTGSIPGFRPGNNGRALEVAPNVLQERIEQEIRLSDRLAAAVLRGWAASHGELREAITGYFGEKELEAEGIDFKENRFRTVWAPNQWETEWGEFTEAHAEFDRDDVGLMLCYVSGKLPFLDPSGSSVSSALSEALSTVVEIMRELPPGAPEWVGAIPKFLDSVSKLLEEKAAALRWADDFDAVLAAVKTEYGELLAFFEQDTQNWSAAKVSPEADTAAALRWAERLRELLSQYQPVHAVASGISEERERRRRRDELQPAIQEAAEEIARLMSESPGGGGPGDGPRPLPPEPPPGGRGTGALGAALQGAAAAVEAAGAAMDAVFPESAAPEAAADLNAAAPEPDPPIPEPEPPRVPFDEYAALQAENRELRDNVDALNAENRGLRDNADALNAECRGLRDDADALNAENRGLRDNVAGLNAESQGLREEVETLKSELYESHEMEESWRLAYIAERGGMSDGDADDAGMIENVQAAVELAQQRFRGKLHFAPNSESSIESNPYTRPEKVWEALQWLATTYYNSKMGQLRVTDFDWSIKEACGWWYKGDQGETTLTRYRNSYTAYAYGKTYWLAEHIGKGTNFDARYTIRIAFDWDDDMRQVIIGYIGRHQQTDAS